MANVKRIEIVGQVPFNYYESPEICQLFAFIQSPSSGFHLDFGKEWFAPNEHGGKTAMYPFRLHGEEAVSFAWVERLIATIQASGGDSTGRVTDIESGESKGYLWPSGECAIAATPNRNAEARRAR